MHSKYRQILLFQIQIDAFEICDDHISPIGCKSIIVLFWDMQDKFQALGVITFSDSTHLGDFNTSLHLYPVNSYFTFLLEIVSRFIGDEEIAFLLPVISIEFPHFVGKQDLF